MPLNQPALKAMIFAAFRKQSVKPGPDKQTTNRELAEDLSRAIDLYVRGGLVQTAVTGMGIGGSSPHPFVYPVFTFVTGTGTGVVV